MKGVEEVEGGASVAPLPSQPNSEGAKTPPPPPAPPPDDVDCVDGSATVANGHSTEEPLVENGNTSDHEEEQQAVQLTGISSSVGSTWSCDGGAESKESLILVLQEELKRANAEVRLRDEEVTRLSRVREEVEAELEELTASLFQEAHNMVREANEREAASERALKECRMQADVLTAEVAALKALVLTSTPSRPNPHLHPQIGGAAPKEEGTSFNRKHRRSPSHFNLKYGRESSPPESPSKEPQTQQLVAATVVDAAQVACKEEWEVDPVVLQEFTIWRTQPTIDLSNPFIARVFREDINPSLAFTNEEVGEKVLAAAMDGQIFIEAIPDKTKILFPRKCALLGVSRTCNYRMKLGDQEQWHCISQLCRNRIIAVCDFLNYLRYIERGLVKSSAHETFWEITRLRKEMVLARLGLPPNVQSAS
ncbi:guanine nucleotide exchange factor for Rab-3A-like [Ischnura elegans]|uniref:guanine nucleotide exchange factor for Rab-3A-like n=1 Tax=Ischnura elegans TaxID=197161 RepID=UPI001ED8A3E9|nr:guanine nucleotide exchange factor for Rab-3A-like [Ischnura elegans]